MSGLAGYARGGQGSSNVSKAKKAREGNLEKVKPGGNADFGDAPLDAEEVLNTPEGGTLDRGPNPQAKANKALAPAAGSEGGVTPFGSEPSDTTPGESPTPEKSIAAHARRGIVLKAISPDAQPNVSSNIPGSDAQGVPAATRDELGALARRGNVDMTPQVVGAQTGLGTHGPAIRSSLARMGGQVGLAPGQFGVWAHPKDPTSAPLRTESKQVTSKPGKPGSFADPAPPVYPTN